MTSLSHEEQAALKGALSLAILRMESTTDRSEKQRILYVLRRLQDKALANWADCEQKSLAAQLIANRAESEEYSQEAEKWLDAAAEIKAVTELLRHG